ncbi:phosphotransferase [Exiguobacterium sp. s143]|uniref:phosphotransferase n=1 Tax=Exiguobacterium sp. s143 TaxID=2751201 RepID=UPI001BE4FDA0|nr:phosphotransferase [Exiguobacterium sp. s143]
MSNVSQVNLTESTHDNRFTLNEKFISNLFLEMKNEYGILANAYQPINIHETQNKNLIVTTDKGKFFAKIYTSGDLSERKYEAAVLNKLLKEDINCISKIYGIEPLLVNGFPVMLFEAIEGTEVKYLPYDSEMVLNLAGLLSEIHNGLSSFDPGNKKRFNAFGLEFVNVFNLSTNDVIINQALGVLAKCFKEIKFDEMMATIIHDDLSPSNVMQLSETEFVIVDFDDMHQSYRISDIGTVVKEFIIQPTGKVDHDHIQRFLECYENTPETRRLSDQEKELVIVMALKRSVFMYAYYRMIEEERSVYIQSNEEYEVIKIILSSGALNDE